VLVLFVVVSAVVVAAVLLVPSPSSSSSSESQLPWLSESAAPVSVGRVRYEAYGKPGVSTGCKGEETEAVFLKHCSAIGQPAHRLP